MTRVCENCHRPFLRGCFDEALCGHILCIGCAPHHFVDESCPNFENLEAAAAARSRQQLDDPETAS